MQSALPDPRGMVSNTAQKFAQASITRSLTVFPFILWLWYQIFCFGAKQIPVIGMAAQAYDTAFTAAFVSGPRGL